MTRFSTNPLQIELSFVKDFLQAGMQLGFAETGYIEMPALRFQIISSTRRAKQIMQIFQAFTGTDKRKPLSDI